jgi:hypothetical protein
MNKTKRREIHDDNWDGKQVILVSEKTLKPVCIGQRVKDFRGDSAVITGGHAPRKPSSEGYVGVKDRDFEMYYYAGVYDLKWVLKEEAK